VLARLDAGAVRRWCTLGLAALRRHQHEIDELNVYPVPDGDTGTNLVLTLGSAYQALDPENPSEPEEGGRPGALLRRMARGALLGARGNSGVIVAQLLRGIADGLEPSPVAGGRALADALTAAAKAAYDAVADPVEGTVLTVASAAALAATAADTDDLAEVIRAATHAAGVALARTPDQLPALARAGVVDAGGRGLVVLLEALVEVVTGEAPPPPAPMRSARAARAVPREAGSAEYAYEVQYLLDAEAHAVERLKVTLAALGDSLAVVGTGGDPPVWNVHVHVNDVGAAIEAGVEAGRPHRLAVTRFADQVAPAPAALERDDQVRAVVVVAAGPGLAELFTAEGAMVVHGGPSSSPSTADVLAAILGTGAGQVAVLPNDANLHAVAAAAAQEARAGGAQIGVVPTRSPVQALAAIAVRDASRYFHDDVIAMAEAAGACRYAEVTVATREALTVAGRCRAGDVLALVEGEVNLIGSDLTETSRQLVDRMLAGGGELVTLILGADAPGDLADVLTRHLAATWPFVEVQTYRGGQPYYPLLVGIE
jgi:DAK2 domain fusion protein YloV